jgi:hypothetical protein
MLINNMGGLLQAQGKLDQAASLFREAMTKAKASPSVGANHPNTKRFAANHSKCLDALGRHDEAAVVRKEFGLPDPTTAPTTPSATQTQPANPR